MSDNLAIRVDGLVRHFGDVKAVDSISIKAEKGSVVALLGPNGAGKTTTINVLTTQILPDAGTASVMGFDVVRQPKEVRRRIGLTFQETSVDLALTGQQVLHFSGELYGMKRGAIRTRAGELLAMVGLTDVARRKTKTYSGGMKRRLELARSLMNSPDVLVLDEPTLGLDPQTRAKVWEYIGNLKQNLGMTLLLTTHYMDEAEQLSDYLYIVDRGVVVQEGRSGDMIRQLGDDTVRLQGTGDISGFSAELEGESFVQSLSQADGNSMHIGVDSGQKRVATILTIAAKHSFAVTDVEIDRPNLGDVFFRATGREIRE